MLVSLVIPVYGVEKYLKDCIDSVLKQNIKDIEIILVDDGSPDKCPEICDEYAKKDARIKVIHKENGGSSSARNAGIDAAMGKYLMFMDSDDMWNEKESVNGLIKAVEENTDIDMFLFSSLDYIEGKGFFKRKEHYNLSDRTFETVTEYCDFLQTNGNFEVAAYTKVFKRDFIVNNKLYFKNGIIAEDSEWMLRVLRRVGKVQIVNKPYYVYRQREGSITRTIKLKNLYDMLGIVKDNLEFFLKEDLNIKKHEMWYCAYLWFCALGSLYNFKRQERKEIKSKFKETSVVCKYSTRDKIKKAYLVYKILGLNGASKVLGLYLKLKNKKQLNMIKVCECE